MGSVAVVPKRNVYTETKIKRSFFANKCERVSHSPWHIISAQNVFTRSSFNVPLVTQISVS